MDWSRDPCRNIQSDADAPIPDIRETLTVLPDSTLKSHCWPRPRTVGRPGSGRSCWISAHANRQFTQFASVPFVLQIGDVKAFGEPAVDRREEIAGFSAAIAAEPGEARGGAQFPELILLLGT